MFAPRSVRRPALALVALALAVACAGGIAAAEQGEQNRILVLPLRGPGGAVARNAIADRIGDRAWVKRLGGRAAQQPARQARIHKADAMVAGAIRCPSRICRVEVVVYRRSGQVWTKASDRATRGNLAEVAAELAESQLDRVGLLSTGGGAGQGPDESPEGGREMVFTEPEPEPEPSPPETEDDEEEEEEEEPAVTDDDFDFEAYDGDDDGRGRSKRRSRYRVRQRYKAVEVYLNFDFTVARLLCMDLAPELGNNEDCDRANPATDDRTYSAAPFTNMGFRAAVFPGAFFRRDAWWSQIGLYVDYGHSLVLSTTREYLREEIPTEENPNPPNESFSQTIDTFQQGLRIGAVGRIPLGGPDRPQLRARVGYGLYEFFLDDRDYPPSVNEGENWRLTERHKRTNPYLPALAYSTFDVGVELRYPLLEGKLIPYTSIAYQIGGGTGQMEEVLATGSTINGVDWELGLHAELPYGIRVYGTFQLIWYGVRYTGEAPDLPPGHLWGATDPAESSSDTIIRFRVGAGWAF